MRRRWNVIRPFVLLACEVYCFVVAAHFAFTQHDRDWAIVAAILLGGCGTRARQLVLQRRLRKETTP